MYNKITEDKKISIKIIKSSYEHYWYADKIGEIFHNVSVEKITISDGSGIANIGKKKVINRYTIYFEINGVTRIKNIDFDDAVECGLSLKIKRIKNKINAKKR